MNLFFGKKQTVQAFAEVLEDGRAITNQEMKKLKYRREYQNEPMMEIAVRVQPENEPPFEVKMKAGISKTYLLMPGVRVQVQYDPAKKQQVVLDDQTQEILKRNPQLTIKQ
jgi:N-methylhydantoinase B/oxoprolinase/acetone carboxylase alpha subunit